MFTSPIIARREESDISLSKLLHLWKDLSSLDPASSPPHFFPLYLYRGHVKAAIREKSSDPSRHRPLVKDSPPPPSPTCASSRRRPQRTLITSVRDFNGVAVPIILCERLFRKYDIANIAGGSGQLFTSRCYQHHRPIPWILRTVNRPVVP